MGDDLPSTAKYILIMKLEERQSLAQQPIIWTGDLDDDCTAIWAGLVLRAEWMDEDYWWWAVYDLQDGENQIDSSNNYDISVIGGGLQGNMQKMWQESLLKMRTVKNFYLYKNPICAPFYYPYQC